ncbi:hypothetical protein ACIP69_18205 [Streptomyces hygroscopicus]|uniref:hypothetical protein n=1 Tax=Streptomyces hygroscopicus TaxID=1912 RepID=UPI0038214DFA
MTARCRSCHRPLRRPSPDGLGPVCRRAQVGPTTSTLPHPGAEPLDHAALAASGQLAIPFQAYLPAPIPSARRRGRHIHCLPDIANYQETH